MKWLNRQEHDQKNGGMLHAIADYQKRYYKNER